MWISDTQTSTGERFLRLPGGRVATLNSVLAEARRQRSAAIKRLVRDAADRFRTVTLALWGPFFGWNRHVLPRHRHRVTRPQLL